MNMRCRLMVAWFITKHMGKSMLRSAWTWFRCMLHLAGVLSVTPKGMP